MALTIQTGTPLIATGANSYASVAEFTAYLTDRGYTVPAAPEPLLIRAYDVMQGLPWCASHLVDYVVTDAFKSAQSEIALSISNGNNPTATPSSGGIKREKVDVLEVEYFSSQSTASTPEDYIKTVPQAYSLLKGLLCSTSGSRYISRA